jgi:hypothetical protein
MSVEEKMTQQERTLLACRVEAEIKARGMVPSTGAALLVLEILGFLRPVALGDMSVVQRAGEEYLAERIRLAVNVEKERIRRERRPLLARLLPWRIRIERR